MKVTGLDGREYSWSAARKQGKSNKKSKLHKKARKVLNEIFPFDRVLEEVSLPGTRSQTRKTTLFADFYIPNRSLIIEVHGRQHFEYVSFFHEDRLAFHKAKARDRDKRSWCELNHIALIEFLFNESEEEWRGKLE